MTSAPAGTQHATEAPVLMERQCSGPRTRCKSLAQTLDDGAKGPSKSLLLWMLRVSSFQQLVTTYSTATCDLYVAGALKILLLL